MELNVKIFALKLQCIAIFGSALQLRCYTKNIYFICPMIIIMIISFSFSLYFFFQFLVALHSLIFTSISPSPLQILFSLPLLSPSLAPYFHLPCPTIDLSFFLHSLLPQDPSQPISLHWFLPNLIYHLCRQLRVDSVGLDRVTW